MLIDDAFSKYVSYTWNYLTSLKMFDSKRKEKKISCERCFFGCFGYFDTKFLHIVPLTFLII